MSIIRWTLGRATCVAGALDIACAMAEEASRGRSPWIVPKAIASGLLGQAAFTGGPEVHLLGLALHFSMIYIMASVAFGAARLFPVIVAHRSLAAIAYGIVLMMVMRELVVPLSAAPFSLRSDATTLIVSGLSHVVLVALPIVLAASQRHPVGHHGDGPR